MRAAILAGGRGTRIGQLYPELPKPMFPVNGKPLLQYQIELLVNQGILEITLIIGYKADIIRGHFGNGKAFGAQIDYIVEDEPLGTGGALSLLPKEDTLMLLGDVFFDVNLARFISFHNERKASVSLFVHPNSHPEDSDIVVTDSQSKILAWKSKKDKQRGNLRNLVNAGLYMFSKAALPTGEAERCDLEQDLIAPMIPNGKIFAYRSTEYIKDMGTPKRLSAVEKDIESGAASARNLKNRQCAVFLDRDGTINVEDGFITKPEQMRLIDKSGEAIRMLNLSSFLTICITNQPVIARGGATFEELESIHARLDSLLAQEDAYLDDLFFCPHHPDKGFEGEVPEYKTDCDCRKPKAGMLLQAAKQYNIDLSRSYMIGDRTADIAAGKAAGCKTVGVRTGAALTDGKCVDEPDIMCEDLSEAVNKIIGGNDNEACVLWRG